MRHRLAILDLSTETADLTITIVQGQELIVSGSGSHDGAYERIALIYGGSGYDTLVGPQVDTEWAVTGANSGSVTSLNAVPILFSGIENLAGRSAATCAGPTPTGGA